MGRFFFFFDLSVANSELSAGRNSDTFFPTFCIRLPDYASNGLWALPGFRILLSLHHDDRYMTRVCMFFLLILMPGFSATARQHNFRNYSIENGLSQSVVNCVYQDSQGFLWIGTQNGLNRFNGHEFTVYLFSPNDTNTISNNWIFAIAEDKSGDLWIGTKGGVNRFLRHENKFRRVAYKAGFTDNLTRCVYDVLVSKRGMIYFNTPPILTSFDPESNTVRHFDSRLSYMGVVNDTRIPLMEDRDGMIWMGSTHGLAVFDPDKESFNYYLHDTKRAGTISNNQITALMQDRGGAIWIGTTHGINILDKSRNSVSELTLMERSGRSGAGMFIHALIQDHAGNVWAGTDGSGLIKMSGEARRFLVSDRYDHAQNGLGNNIVLALAIDRSQNLWAGTLQGISKTDLKPPKFRLYRNDNSSSSVNLTGNVIASVYKDETGKIWIGTWGQGLNIYDRSTGGVEHFSSRLQGEHHLTNDFVHVIFRDGKDNVWIGTRDGIHVFDRKLKRFVPLRTFFGNNAIPDFSGIRIFMIIMGRDGSYWIATQIGLYRIMPDWSRTEIFMADGLSHHRIGGNMIYCVKEDREGCIWIATINGLDVYNPKIEKMKHFRRTNAPNSLADNFIISLCEDSHGDMWIGTGAYVNKFVKKDSTFLYYAKAQGLPNNNIFEILRDQRNDLWFATGGGLARYDTATETFRTYTVEDGLQSLEFNLRACYASSDGEVFFGGMNGLNSFYPDTLNDNPNIPPIVIASCYKSTKKGIERLDVSEGGVVELSYPDQAFTIEFVALEFTNSEKNQYEYMLDGISQGWINNGNRRFVPFSNLSPGTYTFRVRGSNNDGVWNQKGSSLQIVILPPWWRSWWALACYVLLLVSMVVVYVRIRERKLLKERKALEQKVHDRTLQIEANNREIVQKNETLNQLNRELTTLNATKDKFFSIIAHDLRNPFNSILGLSDIVLGGLDNPDIPKIRKNVNDIRAASQHAYDLLQNLLIWARSQTGNLDYNPVEFDLSERIQENLDLVAGQAARKNIILISEVTDFFQINGDIQMINTILRNLLTNAIKFTPRDGEVRVVSEISDAFCLIRVIDNGTGMTSDVLEKIFRLESKYTRKGTEMERGTGLGLILCKEFIEKHGGTITVESSVGKGSCFTVNLPV